MNIIRSIKFAYQKLRYGVSYKDCWSLDVYFAKKIVPALRMFAEMNRSGMPIIWQDNLTDHNALMKEYRPVWEAILWKMIDGFEREIIDNCSYDREEVKYRDECLDLFGEFFFNLWD